jgi:L,D-transpeptidase-like protein/putative peptidoglycan binding protein
MRHTAWRGLLTWRRLFGLGALAGAGALVLGQIGPAAASPVAGGRSASAAQAAAPAQAAAYHPAGKRLTMGMHGPAVRSLQKRLAALKYYAGPVDGRFGLDTLEAVWAFKEIQGLPVNSANQDQVSLTVERRLVHPRAPRALVPHGGSMRIEVNMRNETLVLYSHNKVELISHVSTGAGCLPGHGCGWNTPTGNYRTIWYHNGWIHVPLGEMYNPVFFIGSAYAIHGELNTSVPWYPDSHGCVRIPYDIANFFHKLVKVPGTPVYIRG